MKRFRRRIATLMAALLLSLPLPGCASPGGAGAIGGLCQLALGVGASIGIGLAVRELTK